MDPDVIGAIEITPAVSSQLPTTHQEAPVASVDVPTPRRDGTLTRSLSDPTRGDDVSGEDVYIAADGLEEDCLDSDVLGYIKITRATSSHSPSAPHGSPVVSIAVPSPSSGTPVPQPSPDTITGARPPSARTRATPASTPGASSPTIDQAGTSSPTPDPVADCALRTSIFYTYVKINGQVCKLIVDSGSCVNAVSDTMIPRLGLSTHPHPTPYDVSWIDTTSLPVRL